jgi:hypothetical protein
MAMLKFRAPPLPIAGPDYKQDYFAQLIRALGLYFNQLDSKTPVQWETVIADDFIGGEFAGYGQGIKLPHISASSASDQLAAGDNTPTLVTWEIVEAGEGFTLNNDGTATALYPGVYQISFGLQFANTANAVHDVYVWLQVDGIDVPRTAFRFTIPARKSAGVPSYLLAYSSATFSLNTNQDIALYWATDKAYDDSPSVDGVYMESQPASTSPYTRPAVPSANGSIVFVSALPTPTVTGVYASGYVGSVTVSTT